MARFNNYEDALIPYGYQWLLGCIGIAGPGNLVVVFATEGDFSVACVTHDNRVLWCQPCGGSDMEETNG